MTDITTYLQKLIIERQALPTTLKAIALHLISLLECDSFITTYQSIDR